jgi:hypothetical protein
VRDGLLQLGDRHAAGRDVADQRIGERAVAVDRELAGKRRLAEDDYADPIVGPELVAGIACRDRAAARPVGRREVQAVGAFGGVLHDGGRVAVAGSQGEHRQQETTTTQERDWLLS